MTVRVFLIERVIDGSRYSGEICARSREEADAIAAKIDATVLGTLEESRCCQCGAVLREGSEVKPHLGPDEWPDEVSDS